MHITFFGAIWIVALTCCFLSNDHRRILGLTMFSMVFQSNNVFLINETGIGVQIFTVSIAWVRLWLIRREKSPSTMLSRIKWLLGLLLIILTASLIHNDTYERSNLIPLLMMAIYTLFFFSLSSCNLPSKKKFPYFETTVLPEAWHGWHRKRYRSTAPA